MIKNKIALFFQTLGVWKYPFIITFGITIGVALFILKISNFTSYMSDKPEACINCHVMSTAYGTWERGNHRHVAVCNDCHVPQHNLLAKYLFKAQDGLRHAFMFTFHLEPQVIRIHEAGKQAVLSNCERCHHNTIHRVNIDENRTCWNCHRETPHGRVNSLSAAPFTRLPEQKSIVPEWLTKLLKENENEPTQK